MNEFEIVINKGFRVGMISILILFFAYKLFSQEENESFIISGYIIDQFDHSPIAYASINVLDTKIATLSDNTGYFMIKVAPGNYTIQIRHVGYSTATKEKEHNANSTLNVELKYNELPEVEVTKQIPIHSQTLLGKITMDSKIIEGIPTLFGEPDIMSSLSYIPGVSVNNKGTSGLYVRGGNRNNNLITLDNSPIYYSSHLFGFISSVNSDYIKSVDVYKDGFPANYGGRTSSIISINSDDGNFNEYEKSLSLGLIFSKFKIEGPIVTGKTSFLLTGRTSYYDLFLKPVSWAIARNSSTSTQPGYTFFDVNAKITHKFSETSKLSIGTFLGDDIYSMDYYSYSGSESTKINKLNTTSFISYSTRMGNNINWDVLASYSFYRQETESISISDDDGKHSESGFSHYNPVHDYTLKTFLRKEFNNVFSLKVGYEHHKYVADPGDIRVFEVLNNYTFDSTFSSMANEESQIHSFFIENEFKVNNRFRCNLGYRYSIYLPDSSLQFHEPRFSGRYIFNDFLSAKVTGTIMHQPVHTIMNNFGDFGNEIWFLANSSLPPIESRMISVGIYTSIPRTNSDVSIEIYTKNESNVLFSYIEDLITTEELQLDDLLLSEGEGRTNGIELLVQTEYENWRCSAGYTYSNNEVRFTQVSETFGIETPINNGKWFHPTYYRKHDLTLTGQYISKKHGKFGLNFVFSSGSPITLPDAYINSNDFFEFGKYAYQGYINNHTLPPYHRLDLSYRKELTPKKSKKKYLLINIHNVYSRINPVVMNFGIMSSYKVGTFPIIPTATLLWEY